MKKVFLAVAILIANGVFTSCTDLEDDSRKLEVLATDGKDGQLPDDDDDEENRDEGN